MENKPKWMKVNCPKDMTYDADYPATCSKCKFNSDCMYSKELELEHKIEFKGQKKWN
jgi:hypothetical protein